MGQLGIPALSRRRQDVLGRKSVKAEETSTVQGLDKMPVEIILHILSYLHVFDFFPLKLSNRYIYSIMSNLPHPTFASYVAELEAEEARRLGIRKVGRPALMIAAARGQEALVMRLLQIAQETNFRHGKITGPSALQYAVKQFKPARYRSQFAVLPSDAMDRTPLHWAAENGQSTLVRALVRLGANTRLRDKHCKTALDLAAQNGHGKVAELLTRKELFRARSTRDKQVLSAAFHIAVCNGRKDIVQLLLDRGINIDVTRQNHETALHVAAEKGLDEMICLLLDHGACLEAKDLDGKTALHCAIMSGQETAVKVLLERGASISSEPSFDGSMEPVIHSAAIAGNIAIYQTLFRYGADPHARCRQGTVLHHAARNGHKAMVQFLLNSGVPVDGGKVPPATPFLCAAVADHTNIVSLLLDRGANIDARFVNYNENTALHIAALSGSAKMVRLLLNRGAKLEARNSVGCTPLLCATTPDRTPRTLTTGLLLDCGANIEVKDESGRTVLHNAVRASRYQMDEALISLLLDRGADIHATDNEMRTPLHYAANRVSKGTYQLLRDRGADENARDLSGETPRERLRKCLLSPILDCDHSCFY